MASLLASTHFFSFSLISAASNKLVKTTSSCPWRKNLGKAPRAREKPFLQKSRTHEVRWSKLTCSLLSVLLMLCLPDYQYLVVSMLLFSSCVYFLTTHSVTQKIIRSVSCRSQRWTLALFSFWVTRVSNWKYFQIWYFLPLRLLIIMSICNDDLACLSLGIHHPP